MTLKNKRKFLIYSILLFALSLLLFVLSLTNVGYAQVEMKEEISFKSVYRVGETVDLPQGTLIIGEEEYKAYTVVYTPNGKAVKADVASLSESGLYTIEYRVEKDGKLYSKEYSFNAESQAFTVRSERSFAAYGEDLLLDNYNEEDATGIAGINVALADGDTFNYNKVIDISDNDAKTPLATLMWVPSGGTRTLDAYYVYLRLTDAYDSDNYVDVRFWIPSYWLIEWEPDHYTVDGKALSYVTAAANGQAFKGFTFADIVSVGDRENGPCVRFASWATTNDGSRPWEEQDTLIGEKSSASIYYDIETNIVYASGGIDTTIRKIVDLDDMTYQDSSFKGFSTGEVYLSLYASSYIAETFNSVLTYIDGQDLSDQSADSASVGFFVDYSEYGSKDVKAAVNKPFKIMDATAIDVYHQDVEQKISVKVFKNYYLGGAKVNVPVSNGYFTPDQNCVYTIEYSVNTFSGAVAKHAVDVKAVNVSDTVEFSALEQENCSIGSTVELLEVNALNAIGNYTVEYSVIAPDGQSIEVENGKIKTLKIGEYVITATVSDYVQRTGSISYSLFVSDGGAVFEQEIIIPDFYIANKDYKLPIVCAYDYVKEEQIPVVVTVIDEAGQRTLGSDNTVKFSGDSAIITYTADDAVFTKEIEIINAVGGEWAEEYYSEKFFSLSEGLTASSTDNAVELVADGTSQIVSASFINPLNVNVFNFSVAFKEQEICFDKLSFIITDAQNSKVQLKISIRSDDWVLEPYTDIKRYVVYVNDNRYPYQQVSLSQIVSDNENIYLLNFVYSSALNSITLNTMEKDLDILAYGDVFNGFISNQVFLTIEAEGLEENDSFFFLSVNDQVMSNNVYDWVKPSITTQGQYEAFYDYDSFITIFLAEGMDVFDGILNVTVSVISPSGEYVKDVYGVQLKNVPVEDYKVKLEEFGYYLVLYKSTDYSGNTEQDRQSFVVLDRIAPEVNVEFNKTTAKLNETFTLPRATVSDNSSNFNIYCIIINPRGERSVYNPDNTITFSSVGNWTIRYWALDESGNVSTRDFVISVR